MAALARPALSVNPVLKQCDTPKHLLKMSSWKSGGLFCERKQTKQLVIQNQPAREIAPCSTLARNWSVEFGGGQGFGASAGLMGTKPSGIAFGLMAKTADIFELFFERHHSRKKQTYFDETAVFDYPVKS